jgi:2-polyprenyl-3-methyl-5-hydroxy-6-metoxy-1,4-benzoquinol methylase
MHSGEQDMREATKPDVAPLQCLMCGGLQHRPIFNEFGIDILRCRECHHVFSSFRSDPHYDGFWGEGVAESDLLYWKEARSTMYQDFFERFLIGCSWRLLDMGCGLGFFLKAMAPYANWEAYGCEISPVAVRYARQTLGLTNVICSRLEEADLPQSSFDLITMWDVIDHIPRPDPLLRRCHALLREGGICFIRTPNVVIQLPRARLKQLLWRMQPGVAYLQARDHAHHYSMSSIRKLLERNGFARVQFVHLRPVQTVLDGQHGVRRRAKHVGFEVVRALATVSRGHVNFDNLFVLAHKEPQTRR